MKFEDDFVPSMDWSAFPSSPYGEWLTAQKRVKELAAELGHEHPDTIAAKARAEELFKRTFGI